MYCMQPSTTTISEVSCDTPDALVVLSRVELAQYSPFYLDPESAMAIGGAILLVMAAAWSLRAVRKALETKESE
ncbi:hypothetical protein GmRootA79_40630 [Acidovorax sp. A79]